MCRSWCVSQVRQGDRAAVRGTVPKKTLSGGEGRALAACVARLTARPARAHRSRTMSGRSVAEARARSGVRISGAVQGVGFRPTVYRVARGLGLAGLVRNDSDGVWIEVEGLVEPVDRFVEALRSDLPPLARIDRLEVRALEVRGDSEFVIVHSSDPAAGRAIVPPDVATCDACLR